MGTLYIKDVDLKELEKQRRQINAVDWSKVYQQGELTVGQCEAITSIESMLDAWSDAIWDEANANS